MKLIDTTWEIDQETIYALKEHLVNKRNIQRKKLLLSSLMRHIRQLKRV